jgi:hypothetical protein
MKSGVIIKLSIEKTIIQIVYGPIYISSGGTTDQFLSYVIQSTFPTKKKQ